MESRKNAEGAGAGFLGVGAAFVAIAPGAGPTAFIGVAAALSTPGVVFLSQARRRADP